MRWVGSPGVQPNRTGQDEGYAGGSPASGLPRRFWTRLLRPARYERVEASLRIARAELAGRAGALGMMPSPLGEHAQSGADWRATADALLSDAEAALACGRIDTAWKLLHAARRQEIFGMDRDELAAFAGSLRAEASKIGGWRQQAIQGAVGTLDRPIGATASEVAQATLVRDEHYNNQGYKDRLLRTQILVLASVLAAATLAILGLAYLGWLSAPPFSFHTLAAVTLFGALGATVSAMLRASDTRASARIPELTSAMRVTFMRIVMGGASALIVHLALGSRLTGLFNSELQAGLATSLTAETALVIAFAAGFSERLVLRAVEYVAGKSGGGPNPEGNAGKR